MTSINHEVIFIQMYGDSLEKEMATHSSVLAWRIPRTEEPGGLLSMGLHSRTRLKRLSMHACIGDRKGNPLQCSCLENPRDRGAWWAAIYGVTQSWTQLMQLNSSNMVIHASLLFLSLLENSLKLKLERLFIRNKIYAIICNIYLL